MSKDPNNEFFWSIPREEAFQSCHRKYYFHYYGCWGGWREDAAPQTRTLYALSRLQTRTQWADNRVRRGVRETVEEMRNGKVPDENAAVDRLLEALRKDFRDSRDQKYQANPRQCCGLFEHEYGIQLADDLWKTTAERAAQSLRGFYGSDVCAQLSRVPSTAWLDIEKRAGFRLNGLLVLVNPDFAVRDQNRTILYQWNTSLADAKSLELRRACDVLYAMDRWKIPHEEAVIIEFSGSDPAETPPPPDPEQLDEAKACILEAADEMLFPLADPQANMATEEAFEISNADTPCHQCNFLKICPKWR